MAEVGEVIKVGGESGVVECGYGVEDAVPEPAGEIFAADPEPDGEAESDHELDADCCCDDDAE